jgi:uncharacterized protein Yka (UPF0111/DUF47 family)
MTWPFPPKKDFVKMLSDQTAKVEEGLTALQEFMEQPTVAGAQKVDRIEEEADDLRRIVIEELNRTFITPIDREDIFTVSRVVDDVMDYGRSTAEEMLLFEIKPDVNMKKMVEMLHAASKDIHIAVHNIQKHPAVAAEHLIRARREENAIERRYREGLVELFKTSDVIEILKTREVYRHLSNAADRVVEASNIIGDILVKMS